MNKNYNIEDLKVSRIRTIYNSYDDLSRISISGYRQGSNQLQTLILKHYNYFYYPVDSIHQVESYSQYNALHIDYEKTYTSYNLRKPCYKIYIINNRNYNLYVRNFIRNSKLTHLSDVPLHQKFIHDNKITWSTKRHILYLDIQNWPDLQNPKWNMPENARQPITSIQLYSNFTKRYMLISWHPDFQNNQKVQIIQKSNVSYVICRNQVQMIKYFMQIFKQLNPDIVTGWYSNNFDIPYIINRMVMLSLDVQSLSQFGRYNIESFINSQKKQEWRVSIGGVQLIDMLQLMKIMNQKFPDNKLDTVAKHILGEQLGKQTQVTWKDWLTDYKGFLKYGLRDVEILVQLDQKVHVFETFIIMQQITNIVSLQKLFSMTRVVQSYVFTKKWDQMVFLDIQDKPKERYAGAYVMQPIAGLYKNIAIFDFASLYPNTIMSFNLSPDTIIITKTQAQTIGVSIDDDIIPKLKQAGVPYVDTGQHKDLIRQRILYYSHKYKIGLFPQILRQMYINRVQIKKQMKQDFIKNNKVKTDKYYYLDKRQYTFKILLNSAYGAFGTKGYRFHSVTVAQSVTFFSKQCIHYARQFFKDNNMSLIYTDTDSVFVQLQSDDDTNINNTIKQFNNKMRQQLVKKFNNGLNDDYFLMDMQYQNFLPYLYFGQAKKRYYGIMRNGQKYIKGINVIRKNTPDIIKQELVRLIDKGIYQTITPEDFQESYKLLKSQQIIDIGIYQSFNMQFHLYKNQPQHLKGALFSNQTMGTHIVANDVPLLYYIKNYKDKKQDAICVKKEDLHLIDNYKHIFQIDYDTFFEKQILKQLEQFKYIDVVNQSVIQYKRRNQHHYTLRSEQKCPLCGRRHSGLNLVQKCQAKYLKNNDNMMEEQLKVLFEQFLKEYK